MAAEARRWITGEEFGRERRRLLAAGGHQAMTRLLERALEQMRQLPEPEQDAVAAVIMEELESEERWQKAFAASQAQLAKLAEEARAEYRNRCSREPPARSPGVEAPGQPRCQQD